jgi:hypothetical protein
MPIAHAAALDLFSCVVLAGTGTFQPAPWSYTLGNETITQPDNSTVHGAFGGVGNYTIFEVDDEVQIEEGQVYLLGWQLSAGHGSSRNSFLQFSNGSCSPGRMMDDPGGPSRRIHLFEPGMSLASPAPGYQVEVVTAAGSVVDQSFTLPNEQDHRGAAYVTAPLTGLFRPTPVVTHTTNKEFTVITKADKQFIVVPCMICGLTNFNVVHFCTGLY